MCLGVIATVLRRWDADGVPVAVVATATGEQTISLSFCPDANVGDDVVAHSGFALEVLDPSRAAEARRLRDQLSTSTSHGE
jgi:hydrogenase maturation factor